MDCTLAYSNKNKLRLKVIRNQLDIIFLNRFVFFFKSYAISGHYRHITGGTIVACFYMFTGICLLAFKRKKKVRK